MNQKKQIALEKEEQFSFFFTIVISLLKQGHNLYQALQECKTYIPESLAEQVAILIENQADDSSLQTYLDFATYFDQPIITKICLLLYQYNRSGYQLDSIHRFLPLLEQLRQSNLEARIKVEEQKMNSFQIIPVVSVIVLTIYFALGLLSILVVSANG